ncbi:MAG: hypothetical protein NXY57DRAFT_535412 [Lentinula lateritia]|uniref:Uncharacterized protein n=1 Tax=Lentinula lateritia TaxID=40482 RepID=A0ABQ8VCK5_9AGAR|nr:MAG: hypothetical protein NXY57DRAFT_535412 [Lentinula lateritia]KAJ4487477.1 hypothetical protein C8R41DRAFT_921012 [Lentinula lateritia]
MVSFTSSILLSTLLASSVIAAPSKFRSPNHRRDASPSDNDLLLSCPGAAGSPNVENADKCTLVNIVNNPDTRVYSVVGDPQLNCGGGTEPITVAIGGSSEVSSTTTANVNLGINFAGINIGGGLSTGTTTTQTTSNTTTITIDPGRQIVQTVGVLSHSQSGNVQVNYGDRVDDHFIWFTGAVITQLTPTSDLEFDTHETACGTDPRDFNNNS